MFNVSLSLHDILLNNCFTNAVKHLRRFSIAVDNGDKYSKHKHYQIFFSTTDNPT